MKKFVFIITSIFIGLIALGSFIWVSADSISKAAIATNYQLIVEPITSEKSLVDWLQKCHGEAQSHQAMITFAKWGIDNSERFEYYLGKVSPNVLERVAWAIYDSGISEDFLKKYSENKYENVQSVITKVRTYTDRIVG